MLHQINQKKAVPIIIPPFKAPSHREIQSVLKMLGLKPGYKLFIPEYNTKTRSDVPVGYMYIYKLEHIGDLKIHSRSTGPVKPKTLQPTAGKRRGGGQRMGEAETYSLISYNCPALLAEMMGPLSDDHITKNEIVSEIVQTGGAGYREPKINPAGEVLESYFTAMMLSGR
jgi:DNA-directed RNA polymerase subunit beta